jgi:predicted secreted hydrolase
VGPVILPSGPVADPPWNVWPYHRPGSALSFPRDEGWHRLLWGGIANPDPRHMEWVYLNAHLRERAGAGRSFVVFVAYFTQHLRFFVMRAFDAQDRYLSTCTGTAMGLLRASSERLDLTFDHAGGRDSWRARSNGASLIPFASRVEAHDDAGAFSARLDLECQKRPYEAGGTGYMPFGRRGSFHYYSLTRLALRGELGLPRAGGGQEAVLVDGIGWFDHQWGPFFVTPFYVPHHEQYEWMSIQLDSGEELLVTTVWEPDGRTPSLAAYGGVALIRADGTSEGLVGAHRFRRTRFWRSPIQNRVYAAGWVLEAPEWDLRLTIEPRHRDQLTPIADLAPHVLGLVSRLLAGKTGYFADFWEGSCRVRGTFEGRPANGVAFAELVKRYEDPRPVLIVDRDEPGLFVLRWYVENPDDQVPLRHRFTLMTTEGALLVDRQALDVPVAVLDDPALPRGVTLVARATSSSIDGSLSGSTTRKVRLR